jgi:hypothetical protein
MEYKERNNQNEWLWQIADARVDKLYQEYTSLGYLVILNRDNHAGVDLIVIATPSGRIVKVIESTNYALKTRDGKVEQISKDKLERYYRELNYFDQIEGVEKELVVSFKENIPSAWYKKFMDSKITVIIKGYKDEPLKDSINGWQE